MMRSMAFVASLAVASHAIMIPSTVSLESTGNKHGSLSLVDPFTQILQVGCSGCMFASSTADGRTVWTQGVENALLLNISIGTKPETLELNGVRFYPPIRSLTTEPPVPYISQVPAGHSLTEIVKSAGKYTSKPLRLTSWSFRAGTSQTVNESGEEILTIVLQLNALERQPVSVPDITITALKNTDAQLMLLKIETVEERKTPQQCREWPLLCKWRGMIASGLHWSKGKGGGCHRRPHHVSPNEMLNRPTSNMHHGPESHHDGAAPMEGYHRPHHHTHFDGHGHRHHRINRIVHVFGKLMLTVIVPVLLGVAAGLVTYLFGMLLGAMGAFVWMKVRPSRDYSSISLDEESMESRKDLEKAGFVDEEAAESPPLYAEIEAKEME